MPRPETPLLTVDIIIECQGLPGTPIVLIERKYDPLGIAFPGGFVDIGETVEDAAIREAWEETACKVTLKSLLGVYSDPLRDKRGHTVSIVFIAETLDTPTAQDDAKSIIIHNVSDPGPAFVFDHAILYQDYLTERKNDIS